VNDRLVSLVTVVDDSVTGGHLYNRRMADQAKRHQVRVELIPVGDLPNARGQLVVDSLVAASVPSDLPHGPDPIAALVHQVPGGVEGSSGSRRARRTADLALYRRCDLVIAASPYLGDVLVDEGVAPERVEVVPPGCDLPALDTSPAADMRAGRRLALLNVANWVPNKGILELLEAIEPIPPGEVILHLVGSPEPDPRYADAIMARLASPALREKVVVHGSVPPEEMGRLYSGSDALVLTSHQEGYATVIAEALMAGLPPIAWRTGNVPNLVSDGEDGVLIPPGEVHLVTEAIRRLARDDRLRSRLASNAAARGRRLPTWEQSAHLFFGALDRLLPGAGDTV
jgi:glycosyltransferase involved in cell wall biosynthesis